MGFNLSLTQGQLYATKYALEAASNSRDFSKSFFANNYLSRLPLHEIQRLDINKHVVFIDSLDDAKQLCNCLNLYAQEAGEYSKNAMELSQALYKDICTLESKSQTMNAPVMDDSFER